MTETLIQFMNGLSPEVITGILAMLPLTELRGALPVGMTVLELDPWVSYGASVIGNAIPVFFLLWLLPFFLRFAQGHCPPLQKLFERFIYPLEKKHAGRYQKYGRVFLFIFTAIPLPVSGVWTASVLSVLFEIDRRYALVAILFGMLTAGILVMLITSGVLGGLSFLL